MRVSNTTQSSPAQEHSRPMEQAASSTSLLTSWEEFLVNIKCGYPSLIVTSHKDSGGHWAFVDGCATTSSPLGTKLPIHNPRMVVHVSNESPNCIQYKFEVHFVLLFQGLTTDAQFSVLLQSTLPGSSYPLCPGLPGQWRERVDFESKCARKWGFPLQRTDHVDCKLWFQPQMTPGL